MGAIQEDGTSLRQHMENIQRQTGIRPKELDEKPELPEIFQEVWSWFLRLHSKRTSGNAPNPISYSDMKAFFDMMHYQPEEWEVEAMDIFDAVAMNEYSKQIQKELNKK